jgi:glycosyltransferase involved in cell wall biosynthesis
VKILLVSGIFPPDIGGPATYIPLLASELTNQNHDVTVVTLGENHTHFKSHYKIKYISRNQPKILRIIKSILTIYNEIGMDTRVFANGLHQETAIALRIKRKKKATAKIVGDPVWERAVNKKKTTLEILDFNNSKLCSMRKLQRILIKWSLNQFSVVTCPSEELCNFVYNWGVRTPIVFIPNGVKIPHQSQKVKKYDVLTVSRLVTWKNIDKVMIAISGSNYSMAIVGDGPEEKKLKNLAHKLKIDVQFLGKLNGTEIEEVMNESRSFALLSNYEGLSFSLIQAMAHGLTPIVSNIPGNTAVVQNGVNGIVCDIKDMTNIKHAINKLLLEKNLSQQLGVSAKHTAEEMYSLDLNIKRISSLIEQN